MRRHFSAGDLSLSTVALTRDARLAVVGSWDNSVMAYSVESACGVTTLDDAHDALVSTLDLSQSVGTRDAALFTGAWDATVKVRQAARRHVIQCVSDMLILGVAVTALASRAVGADARAVARAV